MASCFSLTAYCIIMIGKDGTIDSTPHKITHMDRHHSMVHIAQFVPELSRAYERARKVILCKKNWIGTLTTLAGYFLKMATHYPLSSQL